jgi:hypothetical protein
MFIAYKNDYVKSALQVAENETRAGRDDWCVM